MTFASRYGPWAVVAGASEGMGASLARALGKRGVDVVLIALDRHGLDEVAATLPTRWRTVVQDLSEPEAAEALAQTTADLDVGLFIYVAGTDRYIAQFLDKPVDEWQWMFRRNAATVLAATHHFASRLVERGRGGLSLLTSGAAWSGGSHIAVYGATKAFNLMLAESLWAELGPHGVDVLAMVLGPTDTPAFQRIHGGVDVGPLDNPDDVAELLLDNLGNGPTYPPGPSPFAGMTRREAVEQMSKGTSRLPRG